MRTPSRINPLYSLPLAAALAACGAKPQASDSGLSWAHFKPETAFGGPLGRIEALNQGYAADFDKLKICVETGKKTIADLNLVFEVKLAYATWLAGTGSYTEDDWEKFEFAGADKCDATDPSLAGYLTIIDPAKENVNDPEVAPYQPAHLQCTDNGSYRQCQSNGMILGRGRPGSLSYFYHGDQWTKLQSYLPSSTTLTPYVDWIAMDEDIKRNTAAGLDDTAKQALIDRYHVLLKKGDASLAELTGFTTDVGAAKLTTADDPVFKQMMQSFYDGDGGSLSQDYRGQRGAFSVILHETGHQYGMDHAHDPGHESMTGNAGDAKKRADGQWVTDIATMAYGLPYMYLTADDQAGIKDDATNVKAFLASHK